MNFSHSAMTVALDGEWREAAMQSAHCAHNSRTALVMEKVRSRFPHASQMLINCERADLLRFLNASCQIEPLLTGSQLCSGGKGESDWIYSAWYRVQWRDETLEIVFLPGAQSHEAVLCIASNDALLRDFSRVVREQGQQPLDRALRYADGWSAAPDLEQVKP